MPMDDENGHKNVCGLLVVLELKVKKLGPLLVTEYIKHLSYPNMSIIKVGLPFLYSSMKKKSEGLRKSE